MDHGRIPWLEPDELNDDQRAFYDSVLSSPRSANRGRNPLTDSAGRLHGPFNALLHSPQTGNAVQELGSVVRYGTEIPPRSREIAILEVAKFCDSPFEWAAHARAGRNVGLTEEEIVALDSGSDASTFDALERTIRSTVQSLLRSRDLSDEEFATATDAIGLQSVLDLVIMVGYYELLALVMAVVRTPLPESED